MEEYHKIQTVFKRNPETNHKTLLIGEYSLPEFEMLKDIEWEWEEKCDGTNIRVIWADKKVEFRGKTDNADIPVFLYKKLENTFTDEVMQKHFPDNDVALYGEGYGQKIQKVGKQYIPDGNGFCLFDVKVGNWWLQRSAVKDISYKMLLIKAPVVGRGTLQEAIDFIQTKPKSQMSADEGLLMEGLIMRPIHELYDRSGKRRIITKIKLKDFKNL